MIAVGKNLCPACGSPLIAGPRGGMAQNMYCSNRQMCRQGYNVTRVGDRVIWQHRRGR